MADIGIDYDEPIYPWMEAQHRLCIAAGLALPDSPVPSTWYVYDEYNCSPDAWYEVLGQGAIDGTLYTDPVDPVTIKQMYRLKDAGHRIHIVTTRGALQHGARIRALTHEQIEREGIPHDAITFTTQKGLIHVDYALDDHPKNLADWTNSCPNLFLLDTSHNQAYSGPVPRVFSMEEFVDNILIRESQEDW